MVYMRSELGRDGPQPMVALALSMGTAALALGLIGPFGTVSILPLGWRLVFWGGVLAAGVTVARGAAVLLGPLWPGAPIWACAAQSLLSGLILGPMIWALCHALPGGDPALVPPVVQIMGAVMLICLCVAMLRGDLAGAEVQPPQPLAPYRPPAGPVAAPRTSFLTGHDRDLRGQLLRLSADDHYLVIQTETGSARMIMRFRDALREVAALPGYRIHRSHWVAAGAVRHVRVVGRRHEVELIDGTVLPVSQACLGPLRAAGLIDQRGMGRRRGGVPSKIASAPSAISVDTSGRSQNSPPV